MKIGEIREIPTPELIKRLDETQREIFNLRFQRETEQSRKPAEIRRARKLIARIKTVLTERELQETPQTGGGEG